MNFNGMFARHYDLFYRDKDYQGEAEYVISLLQEYAPRSEKLLELGCGTGRHAKLLAQAGYHVVGVEASQDMVNLARERNPNMSLHCEDLRSFRMAENFDAALALFHVISYQAKNEDMRKAFRTVRNHLRPGGVFIFDCWHGPAVLHKRPVARLKRLEDGKTSIIRIAQPELIREKNQVNVHYKLLVKANGTSDEYHEVHKMRYLFVPEIRTLLEENEMQLLHSEEWLTGNTISRNTWGALYIGYVK